MKLHKRSWLMLECLPSFKCQEYLCSNYSLKWRKNLIFGAMTMNLCSDFLPIVLIIHSLDWITVMQSGWIKYVFKSLKYSKYVVHILPKVVYIMTYNTWKTCIWWITYLNVHDYCLCCTVIQCQDSSSRYSTIDIKQYTTISLENLSWNLCSTIRSHTLITCSTKGCLLG